MPRQLLFALLALICLCVFVFGLPAE
jgi:hypothetical protein